MKTPLKIVADVERLDSILESLFFRNIILGGLDRPIIILPVEKGQSAPLISNSLYIVMAHISVDVVLRAISIGRQNVGVMHFADEFGRNYSWYGAVDYVLRHYWFDEACALPKGTRCQSVQWVPNGYRSDVGPRTERNLLPASIRENDYFFSGFFHTNTTPSAMDERVLMVETLAKNSIPAFIKSTDGFSKGFSPITYGSFLENSKFSLTPRGNAAETIRLFDAFECGSIPISLPHDFLTQEAAMKGAPVLIIDGWDRLPDLNQRLQSLTAGQIDEMQRDGLRWWAAFKRKTGELVAKTIEMSFSRYGVA